MEPTAEPAGQQWQDLTVDEARPEHDDSLRGELNPSSPVEQRRHEKDRETELEITHEERRREVEAIANQVAHIIMDRTGGLKQSQCGRERLARSQ
ncbi:hypothetical protein GCM10009674_01840 [Nesterenkonia xinjiangensis]